MERFIPLGQLKVLFRDDRVSIQGSRKAKGVSRDLPAGRDRMRKRTAGSEVRGIEVGTAAAGNLNALLERQGSPHRLV